MSLAVLDSPEIPAARVKAIGGPSGAVEAFNKLESRMESLRGRKMYGVFYRGPEEEYFACLKLDANNPDDLGFEKATIPGGFYARKKVKNWNQQVDKFNQIFNELEQELQLAHYKIDTSRPYIEFYRSLDEMIAMAPVLPAENKKNPSRN